MTDFKFTKTNILTILGLLGAVLLATQNNLPEDLAAVKPWISWALAVEVAIAGVLVKGDDSNDSAE